jgi:Alcohol dehydrogenase GroES-like domain
MPKAGEKEIVLRVEAFGPNRAETMFRRGEYPQYAPELPSALGYEASGTVIAVGPGVTSVKVGERVSTIPSFKMAATGPTARSRAFRNTRRRFPAHLSWTEAAAIWMPYMGSKAWTPTSLRLSGPRGCPGCSHREPRYRRLLREAGAPISGARALRERRPASGQLEPFKANQPAPLHQTIFALLLPK